MRSDHEIKDLYFTTVGASRRWSTCPTMNGKRMSKQIDKKGCEEAPSRDEEPNGEDGCKNIVQKNGVINTPRTLEIEAAQTAAATFPRAVEVKIIEV